MESYWRAPALQMMAMHYLASIESDETLRYAEARSSRQIEGTLIFEGAQRCNEFPIVVL